MPARYLNTPRILWGAMLMSTVLYLVVLRVQPPRAGAVAPAMVPALGGVAVVLAALSFVLPRRMHRQALARQQLAIYAEPDPGGFASFYRQAAPTRKVFADREAAYRAAAMCFQTPYILALALGEAVALQGFVLALLGAAPEMWAPLFTAGFLLILIRFPTERRIVGPLEEALEAKIIGEEGSQGGGGAA